MPLDESHFDVTALLTRLEAEQPTDFEVVLVAPPAVQPQLPAVTWPVTVASSSDARRGVLLHCGALAARGDVLLFLWPDNRLPREALLTIEKNFALLPQTIGGNFHLKFEADSWLAQRVQKFIAKQRYGGRYLGNSGIFVRREVYHRLGGFKPYNILEDFEFGLRLEAYGPTLYLPDKIVTSAHKLRRGLSVATLRWATAITLLRLGLSPGKINKIIGPK